MNSLINAKINVDRNAHNEKRINEKNNDLIGFIVAENVEFEIISYVL